MCSSRQKMPIQLVSIEEIIVMFSFQILTKFVRSRRELVQNLLHISQALRDEWNRWRNAVWRSGRVGDMWIGFSFTTVSVQTYLTTSSRHFLLLTPCTPAVTGWAAEPIVGYLPKYRSRGALKRAFALRFHFSLCAFHFAFFTLRFSLCAFVKNALYFYLCFFLWDGGIDAALYYEAPTSTTSVSTSSAQQVRSALLRFFFFKPQTSYKVHLYSLILSETYAGDQNWFHCYEATMSTTAVSTLSAQKVRSALLRFFFFKPQTSYKVHLYKYGCRRMLFVQ